MILTFQEYLSLREGWLYNSTTEWLMKFIGKAVERVLGPIAATAGALGMGVIGTAGGYGKTGTIGAIYGGISFGLLGFVGGARLNQSLADWVYSIAKKVAQKVKEEESLTKEKVAQITITIAKQNPFPEPELAQS